MIPPADRSGSTQLRQRRRCVRRRSPGARSPPCPHCWSRRRRRRRTAGPDRPEARSTSIEHVHDVTAISLAESLQAMAVQIAALRYEASAESRRRLIVHDAAVEAERRAQALDAQSGPP